MRLTKELTQLGFASVNMTDIISSKLMNNHSIGGPLERAKKVADLFEEVRNDEQMCFLVV